LAIEGEGGGGEGGGGGRGGRGGGAGQVETMPLTPSVRAVGQKQTAVPPLASTFYPELAAVFPLMVHNEMVTVAWDQTETPPPTVFPLMVHDEMATVPPWTATPPPLPAVFPLMVDHEMATVPP